MKKMNSFKNLLLILSIIGIVIASIVIGLNIEDCIIIIGFMAQFILYIIFYILNYKNIKYKSFLKFIDLLAVLSIIIVCFWEFLFNGFISYISVITIYTFIYDILISIFASISLKKGK